MMLAAAVVTVFATAISVGFLLGGPVRQAGDSYFAPPANARSSGGPASTGNRSGSTPTAPPTTATPGSSPSDGSTEPTSGGSPTEPTPAPSNTATVAPTAPGPAGTAGTPAAPGATPGAATP